MASWWKMGPWKRDRHRQALRLWRRHSQCGDTARSKGEKEKFPGFSVPLILQLPATAATREFGYIVCTEEYKINLAINR